jgi:hypothetical protein
MNAKTAFRSMPDYSDDAGYVDPDSGNEQSTFAFMIDAGALIRFNALKYYYARERNAAASLVVRNLGPAPLGDPLPTTTTVGLSYHPIRPVVLAFDYSVPINLVDPALSENPYWAAGVSVAVSQYVSMQTGLMIRGTNPRITMGSKIAVTGIDLNVTTPWTADQAPTPEQVSLSVRFDFGDRGRSARAERVITFT